MKFNKRSSILNKTKQSNFNFKENWNLPGIMSFGLKKENVSGEVNLWDGKGANERLKYKIEVFKGENESQKYALRYLLQSPKEWKKTNISSKLILKTLFS